MSAEPCQICILGRVPLYPGYMSSAIFAQAAAVFVNVPPEQALFHWSTPPLEDTKQPAATPEYSETALMSSGYVAARTLLIMANIDQLGAVPENIPFCTHLPMTHQSQRPEWDLLCML